MDMTPPQAPPALVSTTRQPTIDALSRLAATQVWLAGQQRALPALPVRPTPEGRDGWVAGLEAFWTQTVEDTPGAAPVARVDALAFRLADAMRDEAIVRAADGTLDAQAAGIALRFARATSGTPPPDIEALALRIGLADYAGAVILRARGEGMPVLLFMPDRGWEAFDSMEQLYADSESRLRRVLALRGGVSGVRTDDIQRVVADARFVDSRPLGSDVFRRLARRLVDVQKEKLSDAWEAVGGAPSATAFVDEAGAALDLHDRLDIAALLAARDERLAAAINERRLSGVPAEVRDFWHQALIDYRLAEFHAATEASARDGEAPLTLAGYSHRELKAALLRRHIRIDPDDLWIDVTGSEAVALPALPGTSSPAAPYRIGLAELALRNIGWLDGRRFRVVADALPAGTRAPDAAVLREIVGEVNLAAGYDTYLRNQLSDTHGSSFREASMRLHAARMRFDAAEARVASWVAGETRRFMDDREERGFRMVEAVLDAPVAATRATVGGHRVTVSELVYKGAVVADVLVIGMKNPASVSRVVLYTPGAPDGRAFREFADRATAAREFLYSPTFEAYLLDRLPAEFAEAAANGQRHFRVTDETRRSHWVFGAPGDGRGAITDAPFEDRVIDGSVLNASFHAELKRQAYDLAFLGRSRTQADVESVAGFLGLVSQGTDTAGHAVTGTIGAVNQALRATWRLYDSVKAGDGARAFVDLTEAYTSALAVGAFTGGASHALRPRVPRFPDPRQSLDPRYAIRGVDLAGARADASGIYRLHGRRFIRQQDLVFELRHDPAFDTWRLGRPHALDAAYPGPALQRTPGGGWQVRADLGLRGGRTNHFHVRNPERELADRRVIDGRDLDGLTEFQRWSFQQQFGRNLRSMGEANRIYWQVWHPHGTTRIATMRQRTAWNDALRVARAAPREPLAPGTGPGPGDTWRVLDPADWPASVWHRQVRVGLGIGRDGSTVLPFDVQPGSGLTGVAATSVAPADAVIVPLRQGHATPAWFRLDLHRLRGRPSPTGAPPVRVIEVRTLPVPEYVIQSRDSAVSFVDLRAGEYSGAQASASVTSPPTRSPSVSPTPSASLVSSSPPSSP